MGALRDWRLDLKVAAKPAAIPQLRGPAPPGALVIYMLICL